MNSTETEQKPKSGSAIKEIIEQMELIAIVFAVVILAFSFVFRTCQVKGESMENTLYDKETVIISDVLYTPKRNDIIVFHQTGDTYNEPIVKRVIGLPGDTVNIVYHENYMEVTVIDANGNAEVLQEEYVKYEGARYYRNSSTYVEEGTVFAMGDNRSNSSDSRSASIGLIDQRRILGKVYFRITPFSRMGTVK